MGPRPTLAAPPRLFPRRTGPPVRGAHPRARNAWPQRRVGRAASVVCPPASLSPLGQIAEASRRANQRIDVAASTVAGVARRCPTRPSERTHRRSWWADRAARPVGRVAAVRFPARSSIAPAAGNRMAPKLPNAPPGRPSLPRRAPGGIFPFRLNDDQSAANTPGDVAPPAGPSLIRPRRRRPRERRLRDGHLGVLAGARPPPRRGRIYAPKQRTCDACGPTTRRRRSCGVAMRPKKIG